MLFPTFENGSILRQSMLEALRDFPRKFLDVYFADYGDGVIEKLDLRLDTSKVIVAPGLFKHQNVVYFSDEELTLDLYDELRSGSDNFVYLEPNIEVTTSGNKCNFSLIVSDVVLSEKFEIFRCIKGENSEICMFQNLKEVFEEPYNRINQKYVLFSYRGGSAISRNYFKMFADEILLSANPSSKDIAFAYNCLNGIDNLDLIINYFEIDGINNTVIVDKIRSKVSDLTYSKSPPHVLKTNSSKIERITIC